MSQYKHKISKSRFVSGVQCEKKLYFDLFRGDLKPTISDQQKALFETGNQVGVLAQDAFPEGKDASPESYFDFSKAIENTKLWINEGVETIYEAAFFYDEVLAALDILHHQDGQRWAIEVKSSTSLKDYHITDASLQYWVMTKAGFRPDKFFLMHINNKYIRNGFLDLEKLFIKVDITNQVIANQDMVEQRLLGFKSLEKTLEPKVAIGKHCKTPFTCDYMHHCWQHIPENSVFDLSNARGKDWDLYNKGIIELSSIPEDITLSHRQRLQANGLKKGDSYIDKVAIAAFVEKCTYPLYFFDFETVFPTVPILDNSSPFQQIPFQYSLHIMTAPHLPLKHTEFLAVPLHFVARAIMYDIEQTVPFEHQIIQDPRKSLIEQLKQDFGTTGSIVAYNAGFEKGVLAKLAEAFPEDKSFLNDLIGRFVDLLDVFRNAWYYMPEMGASASIKSVLPAIAPEFSYSDLEISNGGDASATFQGIIDGEIEMTPEIKTNLLKYCERDTEGMVVIWKELLRCIK